MVGMRYSRVTSWVLEYTNVFAVVVLGVCCWFSFRVCDCMFVGGAFLFVYGAINLSLS